MGLFNGRRKWKRESDALVMWVNYHTHTHTHTALSQVDYRSASEWTRQRWLAGAVWLVKPLR